MKHAAAIGLALLLPLSLARADQDRQNYEEIARGRYLTVAGDCMPCHTAMGGAPFAGGRAVETPFGNILSSNITPDRDTGIGAWTDQQFLDALWKGIGSGGRHLYPAMPYPYYTRVSRQDVMAIRAYLNTLPPVHNRVQANQLPFPFNVRAGVGAWNRLFFRSGRFQPVAGKPAEWNRGACLVEGLGHCAACHTGKNMLGGDSKAALQGGALQGWFAPDITGDLRTGLGTWSVDQIVAYLRTGHNDISTATGPMADPQPGRAVARSRQPDPRPAARRAERRHQRGPHRPLHACLRLEALRPAGGGRADLYPQFLGQCRQPGQL